MRKDTHAPLANHPLAADAVEAFLAGVAAVEATPLVRKAVRQGLLDDWLESRERPRRIQVLALGKAAPRMLWGLVEAGVPFAGLGVAPRGVAAPGVDTFEWLPGDHPEPGPDSFAAGRRVVEWVQALPKDEAVLLLLSGGASACVELPAPGVDAQTLVARWRDLANQGLPIEAMNRERATLSALKAGGLGRMLLARTPRLRAWMLQDTDPAHPESVGSGPFWDPAIPHEVLASDREMVAAAGLRLATLGWTVYRHAPRVQGEASVEVERFLEALAGLPGQRVALVGAGEPTVPLPTSAPPGGRCAHAALIAAKRLHETGSNALFGAFASDGVDGKSGASGAWSMASDAYRGAGLGALEESGGKSAQEALAGFDAAGYLRGRDRLVHLGPTGTNVNDLWLALRP